MKFLCIYLGEEKGGCTNAYIYLRTHSQPLLQNCLMDVYETWGRDEVLIARTCVEAFYQIRPGVDPRQGKKESKRASRTKGFTWNAAILAVVSARYSKGWIQGGAKINRGRASPLTKSSFRPNVHSNILMYCRQHCRPMHLFESWLNCLLLVIRWTIKGPWASSSALVFSAYVAALQPGHTAFSGFLFYTTTSPKGLTLNQAFDGYLDG